MIEVVFFEGLDRPARPRPRAELMRLPFRPVKTIEGRTGDALSLPAAHGGSVSIHSVVFHQVLDLLAAAGWQVRQRGTALEVLVAAPRPGFDAHATERSIHAALATAGARPSAVRIRVVDAIPAGRAGKRPLIVAMPTPGAQLQHVRPAPSPLT